MLKKEEISRFASCWNKALPEEWVFVLLGRDAAAPVAIEAWCQERIRLGKNQPDDLQIREARAIASTMLRLQGEEKKSGSG